MKFTVVKLFNHNSYGLTVPHYAVVADLPKNLGGGACVLDVLPVSEHLTVEEVVDGYKKAEENMPYRAHEDGSGEIDFMSKDFSGHEYKQSTGSYPAKSLLGRSFLDEYKNWLCWRARVGLWESRDRQVLPDNLAARVLETVSPTRALEAMEFPGLVVRTANSDAGTAVAVPTPARVPLTHGRAPV